MNLGKLGFVCLTTTLGSIGCRSDSPTENAGPEKPTEIAVAELATEIPTSTPTSMPSSTSTQTPSPTSSNTPTQVPTETATSSATATVTLSATPTVTKTATWLPPTATPLPPAPTYPNTPTVRWDESGFITSVSDLKVSIDDFLYYFGLVVTHGNGKCSLYWPRYAAWESLPAYTDVPAAWYDSYLEYRMILHELRIAVLPISDICEQGGGSIQDETDQQILTVTANLKERARILGNIVGAG